MKSAGSVGRQLEALAAEECLDCHDSSPLSPSSPASNRQFRALPEANYKSSKVALEKKMKDGINTNTLPKSFPKVDSAEAVVSYTCSFFQNSFEFYNDWLFSLR